MNNTIGLTDLKIKNLPLTATQYEIFDSNLPNFGIRVSPGGARAFVFYYRIGRQKKRLTLGRYPHLKLKDARELAREAQKRVTAGEDPQAEKLRDRNEHDSTLFSCVVDRYIDIHAKVFTRSSHEKRRVLNSDFVSRWGKLSLLAIDKKMILRRLDEIRRNQGPSAANHAYAAIRAFFNWCVEYDYVSDTPCKSMKRPAPVKSRDRVLTDQEVHAVWLATEKMGYPFGPYVRLLILTGQRRNEVAKLRWSDLDFDENVWSQRENKSKRPHVVPLAPVAVGILKNLPGLSDELVFPARGSSRSISGFSKWKKKLDQLSGVSNWTLHDLRRTCATKLAELGVEPHVTEFVLNHSSQVLKGVASVYNRHAYIDEKRKALELWSGFISNAVSDTAESDGLTS